MKLLCLTLSLFIVFTCCAADEKCVEGASYQESCNTCTCTDSGVYVCTLRACYEGPTFPDTPVNREKRDIPINDPGYTCTPGATFKELCNTCTCDSSGTLARCTAMACDPNEHYRKRREAEETCTFGEVKKIDCNTCTCSKNGLWACTRMGCPPQPIEIQPAANIEQVDENICTSVNVEDCIPVEHTKNSLPRLRRQLLKQETSTQRNRNSPKKVSFNLEASTTTLSPTTTANKLEITPTQAPTTKTISSTRRSTYERGTADRIVTADELKDPAFRCVPSLSFKLDCNTCWCSSDGKSARYCTRIACHTTAVPASG